MATKLNSFIDLTEPMHVWYDLSIMNNDTTGQFNPVPLSFTENRNSSFLSCPEDYYLSIVKFQIQTGDSLPIMIPQVQLTQTDPNLLIYSITLTYKTFEQQEFVYYFPDDLTQTIPAPPLDQQDLTSQYYFISSYQTWIEMVNKCFKDCFANLNVKVLAGGDTLPTSFAPFMEFDPQNLVGIINADILGYNRDLLNPIKIYMNSPMYNLFSSFPATIVKNTNVINGKNVLLTIFDNNQTNILNLPTYNALQIYQESSTVALWNPISAIVFTTSLLPIVPSNTAVPKILNSNPNLLANANNANINNIISDFTVPIDAFNRYKPNIVYTPSGEYRLFNLNGNSPISAIEITAYWRDNFGGLHNVYLNSGCGASIKILFRRKDYYSYKLLN
jgi:hypothetical protein